MEKNFKKAFLVATITFLLDFVFHFFLTHPMESLTYFVIKFFLSFFVATGLFGLKIFVDNLKRRSVIVFAAGLVFSTLMSVYYRAWELGEAGVPFGSRAPNIFGIDRHTIWFPLVWWLGHAAFFAIGAIIAGKLIKKEEKNF